MKRESFYVSNFPENKNFPSCQTLPLSYQCKKENAELHSCELFILLVIEERLKWSSSGENITFKKSAKGKRRALLVGRWWCLQALCWFPESPPGGDLSEKQWGFFSAPKKSFVFRAFWHHNLAEKNDNTGKYFHCVYNQPEWREWKCKVTFS